MPSGASTATGDIARRLASAPIDEHSFRGAAGHFRSCRRDCTMRHVAVVSCSPHASDENHRDHRSRQPKRRSHRTADPRGRGYLPVEFLPRHARGARRNVRPHPRCRGTRDEGRVHLAGSQRPENSNRTAERRSAPIELMDGQTIRISPATAKATRSTSSRPTPSWCEGEARRRSCCSTTARFSSRWKRPMASEIVARVVEGGHARRAQGHQCARCAAVGRRADAERHRRSEIRRQAGRRHDRAELRAERRRHVAGPADSDRDRRAATFR